MVSLASDTKFGFVGSPFSAPAELHYRVQLGDDEGYDSFWVGDHLAYTKPILDPLLQLAQASVVSRRLTFGTSVFLLPLRHPTLVAKTVSSLDTLSEGRLIFGVGIGGEFPEEYAAVDIPHRERGMRASDSIRVIRRLWGDDRADAPASRFFSTPMLELRPPPTQPGGPPIWVGGRSSSALTRAGQLGDGWLPYLVTPEMYAEGLQEIASASADPNRAAAEFGTGLHLFVRIENSRAAAREAMVTDLSSRYGMDMGKAVDRYTAHGTPSEVADVFNKFTAAGCRHFAIDFTADSSHYADQLVRFAREVRPLVT